VANLCPEMLEAEKSGELSLLTLAKWSRVQANRDQAERRLADLQRAQNLWDSQRAARAAAAKKEHAAAAKAATAAAYIQRESAKTAGRPRTLAVRMLTCAKTAEEAAANASDPSAFQLSEGKVRLANLPSDALLKDVLEQHREQFNAECSSDQHFAVGGMGLLGLAGGEAGGFETVFRPGGAFDSKTVAETMTTVAQGLREDIYVLEDSSYGAARAWLRATRFAKASPPGGKGGRGGKSSRLQPGHQPEGIAMFNLFRAVEGLEAHDAGEPYCDADVRESWNGKSREEKAQFWAENRASADSILDKWRNTKAPKAASRRKRTMFEEHHNDDDNDERRSRRPAAAPPGVAARAPAANAPAANASAANASAANASAANASAANASAANASAAKATGAAAATGPASLSRGGHRRPSVGSKQVQAATGEAGSTARRASSPAARPPSSPHATRSSAAPNSAHSAAPNSAHSDFADGSRPPWERPADEGAAREAAEAEYEPYDEADLEAEHWDALKALGRLEGFQPLPKSRDTMIARLLKEGKGRPKVRHNHFFSEGNELSDAEILVEAEQGTMLGIELLLDSWWATKLKEKYTPLCM